MQQKKEISNEQIIAHRHTKFSYLVNDVQCRSLEDFTMTHVKHPMQNHLKCKVTVWVCQRDGSARASPPKIIQCEFMAIAWMARIRRRAPMPTNSNWMESYRIMNWRLWVCIKWNFIDWFLSVFIGTGPFVCICFRARVFFSRCSQMHFVWATVSFVSAV